MELRQLEALVAVEEHGSFSAAARALHTVQSNISTHVARLERELGGVCLYDRSRGVLTEEGRAVVERARRIQRELAALAADVRAVSSEVEGTVRLGVIGTTARWLVPRLLAGARDRYPGVRIVVVDASTTSLAPQVVSGDLDMAVLNLPVDRPEVTVEPLFSEDLLLVAPGWHPLAAREAVGVRDLEGVPLVLEPPGTAFRDDLDREAAEHGVALSPLAEVDGMRLVATLAFEGFGPAVLPTSAVPDWIGGDFRVLRLDGFRPRVVGLARRSRGLPSAPAKAVAALVREVVAARVAGLPGLHPGVDPQR